MYSTCLSYPGAKLNGISLEPELAGEQTKHSSTQFVAPQQQLTRWLVTSTFLNVKIQIHELPFFKNLNIYHRKQVCILCVVHGILRKSEYNIFRQSKFFKKGDSQIDHYLENSYLVYLLAERR